MGKVDDSETCVDLRFRLIGLEGLRIVDLSVAPVLPRYVIVYLY